MATTLQPFVNPFGAPGTTPAFSPKFQANAHLRYDWTMDNFNPYVMGGVSYTGSMYNQPATYTSGVGVVVPNTTFLRYLQPGYTTFDAAIGVNFDKWYAQLYGQNLGDSHASTFTSSAQFIKSEVPLRPADHGSEDRRQFLSCFLLACDPAGGDVRRLHQDPWKRPSSPPLLDGDGSPPAAAVAQQGRHAEALDGARGAAGRFPGKSRSAADRGIEPAPSEAHR